MSTTSIPTPVDANLVGRTLAAWLLPFILDELKARKAAKAAGTAPTNGTSAPAPAPAPKTATPYTVEQCAAFVAGLSDNLLRRMLDMFTLLRDKNMIGSQEMLSKVPEAKTASGLAATLTNHVKRRAKSLNLPYPWKTALDLQGRVTWQDDGTTAARMVQAIEAEQARRQPQPAAH